MKKIVLIFLTVIAQVNVFGQVDKHGNPVFNSELISEEKLDGFELTSSYYTVDNNISNKGSSVYVIDKPTLTDYLKFARDLPSNFFIIHQGQSVMLMIMVMQKNDGSKTSLTYKIVNPNNGKSMQVPCNVWGEVSEKRADELVKLNVDTSAKIIDLANSGKGLLFNGIVYRIQPYDKLKAEVIEIAKQLAAPEEKIKDPIEYIKKETVGGKLDFNKLLEKETQTLFLYDGVAYNKKDFAIYLWGKKVKVIGINSSENAAKLWEEINGRTLTDSEKKAIINGFDSKTK
ncbi:hypothetical protein [Paraflavitalea sp. CAU 1676]|uniref:hypothetical protein n=1 Tax=Paraflavitalea sp. CAU 1676 TaxID=3032598 RepID=UPI0023DA5143|nr:hypothetical protein [Paraflavitalea sp. CAU 1676]MDF2189137.1 hypothetical protein [Paraflavitalea sp. CAU 1676]